MEKIYERTKGIQEDKVSGFCPGCMHSTVAKLIGEVLEELDVIDRAVLVEGVGCCGFAGDKGFSRPELNAWALRKLKPEIEEFGAEYGYSNSRTCEIGLQNKGGIPYMSIVYLVNEVTTAK